MAVVSAHACLFANAEATSSSPQCSAINAGHTNRVNNWIAACWLHAAQKNCTVRGQQHGNRGDLNLGARGPVEGKIRTPMPSLAHIGFPSREKI
ncbi:MAG: hypothetical protein ACHP78_14910 [Terriglobales bacterium]